MVELLLGKRCSACGQLSMVNGQWPKEAKRGSVWLENVAPGGPFVNLLYYTPAV